MTGLLLRDLVSNAILFGVMGIAVVAFALILFRNASKGAGRLFETIRRNGMLWGVVPLTLVSLLVSYAGTKSSGDGDGGNSGSSQTRVRRRSPTASTTTDATSTSPTLPTALTDDDYAAGFVLSQIGTNETWNFEVPEGATVREDWLRAGAADDWFRLPFAEEWTFPFGMLFISSQTYEEIRLRPFNRHCEEPPCGDAAISNDAPLEKGWIVTETHLFFRSSTHLRWRLPRRSFLAARNDEKENVRF